MGAILKRPPFASSRIAANTLGKSKYGKQEPVDRAVHPDKRDGLKVSDDPVVLDRLIGHEVLPCVGLPVVLPIVSTRIDG